MANNFIKKVSVTPGVSKRHVHHNDSTIAKKLKRSSMDQSDSDNFESKIFVSSDEYEYDPIINESENLHQKLLDWSLEFKIENIALNAILKILFNAGLNVPTNSRDLALIDKNNTIKIQSVSSIAENDGKNCKDDVQLQEIDQHDDKLPENQLSTIHNLLVSLNNKISTLESTNIQLQQQVAAQTTILGNMEKKMFRHKPTNMNIIKMFKTPMNTFEDIEKVNELLMDPQNAEEFINHFSSVNEKYPILGPGFSQIMTDELLGEYNWDGLQGKNALKDHEYLCTCLFECLIDENISFDEFKSKIKKLLKTSHGRNHAKVYRQKHHERLKSKNMLSKSLL